MVFYGEPAESQDADLTGKLVLTSPESMSVKAIKITLTGLRRVAYVYPLFFLFKQSFGPCFSVAARGCMELFFGTSEVP